MSKAAKSERERKAEAKRRRRAKRGPGFSEPDKHTPEERAACRAQKEARDADRAALRQLKDAVYANMRERAASAAKAPVVRLAITRK